MRDVCITDIYAAPSVRQLAAMLEERGRAAGAAGGHRQEVAENPPVADYPASYQQVSLGGMAAMSADASRALNLTFCCHVRGCLDVERLHQAFVAVQLRHDALRSTFRDSALCQVQSGDCLDFLFMDPPADLAEWVLDQQYEPFDLCNGPLCRVRVIKESSDAWILHWTLHHVAADLWSSFDPIVKPKLLVTMSLLVCLKVQIIQVEAIPYCCEIWASLMTS